MLPTAAAAAAVAATAASAGASATTAATAARSFAARGGGGGGTAAAAAAPLAAAWLRATSGAPEWAVEALGLVLVQLVCFWLPALAEWLFAALSPARAEAARLQPRRLPRHAERRHCLGVVLRNTAASEALHFAVLSLTGWRASTRVHAVSVLCLPLCCSFSPPLCCRLLGGGALGPALNTLYPTSPALTIPASKRQPRISHTAAAVAAAVCLRGRRGHARPRPALLRGAPPAARAAPLRARP